MPGFRTFVARNLVAATCVSTLVGASASAQQPPAPAPWWQSIVKALGWDKGGPAFVGRGDAPKSVPRYGDLYRVDAQRHLTQVTEGKLLRSPLAINSHDILALDANGIVRLDLAQHPVIPHPLGLQTVPIARLIAFLPSPERVAFLDEQGCVLSVELQAKAAAVPIQCGITDQQQAQLLAMARSCKQQRVSEMTIGDGPTRIDVILYPANQRSGKTLTSSSKLELNADPIFAVDCKSVLFVGAQSIL